MLARSAGYTYTDVASTDSPPPENAQGNEPSIEIHEVATGLRGLDVDAGLVACSSRLASLAAKRLRAGLLIKPACQDLAQWVRLWSRRRRPLGNNSSRSASERPS